MTLKELYEALTIKNLADHCPYVVINNKSIKCDSKVIEEYGDRIVHDITIAWEHKKLFVFLKATDKEIAEAFMDGFLKG